jgi:hypothetical protein
VAQRSLTLPQALRAVAREVEHVRTLVVSYELQLLPLVRAEEAADEEDVALVVLGMLQVVERELLVQAIEGLIEAAHLAEGTAPHEFP